MLYGRFRRNRTFSDTPIIQAIRRSIFIDELHSGLSVLPCEYNEAVQELRTEFRLQGEIELDETLQCAHNFRSSRYHGFP